LYVGGYGPGNYTKIQDAIDNASDGDTVYVYNGTYDGNISVNKSINLLGENKETTIIDGINSWDVVTIYADFVVLNNFTVKNSEYPYDCIQLHSNYNTIENNNIVNTSVGISLSHFESSYNTIRRNNISNNDAGIFIPANDYNNISENIISSNNIYGITLYALGHKNIIYRNKFISNGHCNIQIFEEANFPNGSFSQNEVINNTFLGNGRNARLIIHDFISLFSNKWQGNYWSRPHIFPKLIFGTFSINDFDFPIINIDWHPAKEPYDIGGMCE
jgi:parallel beta-helix repeat protein